jgi:hypothetical protein
MIMKNRVGREEDFSIFHKIHRCENYSTDKQKIGVEIEKRVKNEIGKNEICCGFLHKIKSRPRENLKY